MRSLHLPMVASKLADPEAVAVAGLNDLPPGLMLSQHQLETTLALQNSTAPIIFNTAMTGDGKSLASQLRFWTQRKNDEYMLAMYPTNELIHDQLNAVQRAEGWWGQKVLAEALNSRTLDEAALKENRGAALLRILSNRDLILTNPDIIHYLMQLYYRRGYENPDSIMARFADLFVQWTFDEFHVFETPQVTAVMNALLLLQERGGPRHFLFLSATPGEQFLEYLHRAELASVEINGTYNYGSVPPTGWRTILQETTLHFAPGKAEEWVPSHLTDMILPFFESHKPGAKGAIIVNSVATALRLTQTLTRELRERGVMLTVAANTGLTGAEGRRRSYEADLLIATATVDVGVDFQINFLIFESLNSGTFLQRLGRLGRHESYTRSDGQVVPFQQFVAYALVPDFVYERLFEGKQRQPPLIGAVETLNRQELRDAIRAAFPQPTSFPRYGREWGLLQTVAVCKELGKATIKETWKDLLPRYANRTAKALTKYQPWQAWKEADQKYRHLRDHHPTLLEEARSFRGGSPWQVAAIDESQTGADRVLLYDLRQLLSNYAVSLVEKEEFYEEVKRWGQPVRRFERAEPITYVRLHGLLEKRRYLTVLVNEDVLAWGIERLDTVIEMKGLALEIEGVDELNALNRAVARRTFVALVSRLTPSELQRQLYLPVPFPIDILQWLGRETGSVAFAREALLLETALKMRKPGQEGSGAIIV